MDAIHDQLGSLEIENHEHRSFVPYSSLEQLLTHDAITELVQQCNVKFYQISEVVNAVVDGGLRVFATLIAIRDVGSISQFLKVERFSGSSLDSKLPLIPENIAKFIKLPLKRQAFIRNQWKFLAPVISSDQLSRDFDEHTVLPFLSKKPLGKNGAFGEVYAVRIHAASHRMPGVQTEAELVCKQLAIPLSNNGSLAEDFEHELHILSALRCLKHPNIIQLITAFTLNNSYNFLLPRADGDLKDLLNSSYRPRGLQTLNKILASLWGLASALESIHNYFFEDQRVHQIGCHYDIKPRNILYANGKLILSDFGLSRLRSEEEGSQTLFQRGEGWYMAPECEATEDDFKPGRIGRASDIWSFGCVFTEIMVYMSAEPQEGPAMVKKFYNDRKIKLGGRFICHHFHSDTGVNPAVTKALDDQIQCSSTQPEQSSLATLAHVIKSILRFDATKRPSAKELTRCMFHITQKMILDEIHSLVGQHSDSMDLELQIESQRLVIWSKISGLDAAPLEVPTSTWFGLTHTYQEFDALQELLKHCLLEIRFIYSELSKGTCPPFRLYYRLQKLQDELWNMLPRAARQKMLGHLEEQMLHTAYVAIEQHSRVTSESGEDLGPSGEWRISMTRLNPRRLACLTTMREIASALVQEDFHGRNMCLNKASLEGPPTKAGHHSTFLFTETNSRVLVERLTYADTWVSHVGKLIERVDAIATLRNRGIIKSIFNVLQCRGYYHDTANFEFGFVYDLPAAARNANPITLAEAFKLTSSRSTQPSLTQRFKLAKSLVSHVLDFHRGGWLHKGISAFSIICFPDAFSSVAESLSSVFFIGFNNSRTNTVDSFTDPPKIEKEYQHPLYLRSEKPYVGEDGDRSPQRFRQEFDYYSTGMVLIEIALWKPLEELTRKIRGSPEILRDEVIKTFTPLTKTYMGDMYGEAVHYCLTAYNRGDRSAKDARNAFCQNVVVPLDRCSV